MHADLLELGWTEEHMNRINAVVAEEAQKARIAAQLLPVVGPIHPSVVAVPSYRLSSQAYDLTDPNLRRLAVDSDPTLSITTIGINVFLRSHEVAEADLTAALAMFRRAANYISRIEDALVFSGRMEPALPPRYGVQGIPLVYTVTGSRPVQGIFVPLPRTRDQRIYVPLQFFGAADPGSVVFDGIVRAIDDLEAAGQLGPYACVLAQDLFEAIVTPRATFVLPRDRILPFLQGPLLRSSALVRSWGAVIALNGSPIELLVASELHASYLQASVEPRYIFRVCERVALRIEEEASIAILQPDFG